jgi:hypothetical protein
MIRGVGFLLLVLMLAAPVGAAAGSRTSPDSAAERRDSGIVVKVEPDSASIVLEEMGPWRGPGTGLVTRSIHIASRAPIRLITPTGHWDDRTATPGWSSTALALSSLRPGDFVTATLDNDRRDEAVALQVVRPGA